MSLAASVRVLHLELMSQFPVLICYHIVKQAILSLLAGLIRCHIIKLKMIVRRVLRSMVPVLLIVIRAKIIATNVRDDVIIVGIRTASIYNWSQS
jgi:hypothetical protein